MSFAPTSSPDLTHYTDESIAAALSRLPLPRIERIAQLLVARMNATARTALAQAVMAAPGVAGNVVGDAVEAGLRSFLSGKRRS